MLSPPDTHTVTHTHRHTHTWAPMRTLLPASAGAKREVLRCTYCGKMSWSPSHFWRVVPPAQEDPDTLDCPGAQGPLRARCLDPPLFSRQKSWPSLQEALFEALSGHLPNGLHRRDYF